MSGSNVKYQRSEQVAWRIIEGVAVIVTPRDGTVHQLNETGTWLWNRLESPADALELAGGLCEEFEVDMETARVHADEFIENLLVKGIVVEVK